MKLIIMFILFFVSEIYSVDNFLPANDFYPEWQMTGDIQSFSEKDLYGHINGGAELFLEFGFDTLLVAHYKKDSYELALEIYKMESPLSALGIYLMKCGKENPQIKIKTRNTSNRFQTMLLRDKYFVQINNFSGNKKLVSVIIALANQLINTIPENSEFDIFNWLPESGRIKNTELIIRGRYGLQSIYTFGPENILNLSGKNYALVADYKIPAQGTFSWLKIQYEQAEAAREVFNNIKEKLDPLSSVMKSAEDSFTFIDYKKEYGIVRQEGNFISIKINLKTFNDR